MNTKPATIKTTVGKVIELLNPAIEYHRLKMTHGYELGETIRLNMFKSERLQRPLSNESYWVLMMQYSPWNEIEGIFNAALSFPAETEMEISVKLASYLSIGARGV